jgi:SNF2 family DNA or RNA helicase
MSSSVTIENMETIVCERMERFVKLIDTAKLDHKSYQYNGVEWCLRNEIRPNPICNIRGGFIADEMGLGKTITIIGLMYANFLPHTLIVVPPILIHQWSNEIHRITGHVPLVYYGDSKHLATLDLLQTSRIVLTTYKTLTLRSCILHQIAWNRIVHDEAHHLRNQNTRRYKAAKNLQCRIRWIVSGTPIQNSSKDFFSLCKLIGFSSMFLGDEENHKKIVKHFVLRRTKKTAGIHLPNILEHNIVVPWSNSGEKSFVEEVHSLIPNISRINHHDRNLTGISTIVAILRTKQTCILPSLIENGLEKIFGCELASQIQPNIKQYTAKLDCIVDTIDQRKNNEKGKIVFCHYRSEIDFIYQKLNSFGIQNIYIYDGRNSGTKSMQIILDKASIVLLQIQTGCEGLNLQDKFSEVYFTSPHWNPFVEDQAIARCHRVGQQNNVEVFKFVMEGFGYNEDLQIDTSTLEKYIHTIHEKKRKTEQEILAQ